MKTITKGGNCLIVLQVANVDYIYSFGGVSSPTAIQRFDIKGDKKWQLMTSKVPANAIYSSCVISPFTISPFKADQMIITVSGGTFDAAIYNYKDDTWEPRNILSPVDLTRSDLAVIGNSKELYAIGGGNPVSIKAKKFTPSATGAAIWPDVTTGNFMSNSLGYTSTLCISKDKLKIDYPTGCTGL